MPVDEAQELVALLEEKRVRHAREDLNSYCTYIPIPGVPISDDKDCEEFYPDQVTPAAHHKLINKALESVESGNVRRLMLFMPPGAAKTTFATITYPTWFLGKKPGRNVIACSYGSDLAKKFARRCRSIVRSREYQEIFKCTLTGDNAAVDDWSMTNSGTFMAGGILSGIMGNRADLLILDDPIKGREEADSKVIRDKVWEAYKSDLRTRLKPGGAVVLIMTRWHEDDLAGRILPEDYNGKSGWITARDGEKWYVLSLQAECERDDDPLGREMGEFLWTEWFPPEHWEQEKRSQGPRNWSALFQQRPAPEEGDYFKRDWIRWYDWKPGELNNGAPVHLRKYGASDYAVTAKGGDWTIHGVIGVDPNDDIYILDWYRGQTATDVWIDTFLEMAGLWETEAWGEEAGQIIKSVGPFIEKRMKETGNYFYRRQYPSTADKEARAQAFRGRMAQGKVYFPRGAPWVEVLVSELLGFPTGKNSDQVDVLSLFGRMLTGMRPGKEPDKPKKPKPINTAPPTFDQLQKWSDEEDDQRRPRI